jgi:peptide/nickel transport system substrate-binding protein
LALGTGAVPTPEDYVTLVVGVGEGPVTIDPIDSWDSASNDVLMQVTETLFWYDLTDPTLPLLPLLVEDFAWDDTDTLLSLKLREDVWFHDYTKFNADAVKWNVDRWLYFTNSTGLLPATEVPAFPSSLYFLPNGTRMIMGCTVVSEYNCTIELHSPFGPFVSFMSYASNSIISPTAHEQDEYIDLTTGDLVGTGAFIYDSYRTDIEVRFTRWGGYWKSGVYFEKLVFNVIEETSTRNAAMQAGDIDILFGADPTLIDTFIADPDIHVEDAGTDFLYWYMSFNNDKINVTWRKALSLAYNYSYVIEEIRQGNAVRGCPAVPAGMPGHNASVQAYLDAMDFETGVEEARGLMQDMGFGVGWDTTFDGTDEALWEAATFFTTEFGAPCDLNEHQGSSTSNKLNVLAQDNWAKIGVDTAVTVRDWDTFLQVGELNPEQMDAWYVGWGPDYNDAFNMLDPLFNPLSASNFAQVDIPLVNSLLEEAGSEPDTPTRLAIYERLQYLLFQVNFVQMPLWATLGKYVHAEYLEGYPYNAMSNFLVYPMYFEA